MIRLVIGLGNPGREYASTRHNLGFVVLDTLAHSENLHWSDSSRHESLTAAWKVSPDRSILLAKPLTYMNLSGRAVRSLLDYYKAAPAELLVVCDDCDLPAGELRLKARGSAGGHNGLSSIIDHLQTSDFPRLRLGIGPRAPGADLSDFVLGHFRPEEKEKIQNLTSRAVSAIRATLFFSLEKAMNEFNRKEPVS